METAETVARPKKRLPRTLKYLVPAVLVFLILGFLISRDHWWFRDYRCEIWSGSHPDKTAKVYRRPGGLLLVMIMQEYVQESDQCAYLIDLRQKKVYDAGAPFISQTRTLGITESTYPYVYVLDGLIEPPSFNAKLVITPDAIEFTPMSLDWRKQEARVRIIGSTAF